MGRAGAAIITLIVLLITNKELLQIDKIFTIFMMICGTIIIYSSLYVLKGGICFFTTQSLEIMNIFSDGSRELTRVSIKYLP